MAIGPEGLKENRKKQKEITHNRMMVEFDKWLSRRLTHMDGGAYPLPYRIEWKECWNAVKDSLIERAEKSGDDIMVSPNGVISDVLKNYKTVGWGISRETSIKGWWIFKKRVDELLFDKKPADGS